MLSDQRRRHATLIIGMILLAVGVLIWSWWFVRLRGPVSTDLPPTTNKPANVVYVGDFTQEVGSEWSQKDVWSSDDNTQTPFLGPMKEKPLTLTLNNLPSHQFIHVTFKLLTYQPWDGDSEVFGRDLWDMRVVGGQPLIHTSLSNCGFFRNNNEQSFPDQYPWYPTHPGWTGSNSFQSLGSTYRFTTTNGQATHGDDSVYSFDLTFPHAAASLQLQFKSFLKRHEPKPYGFLNFSVETVDHAAPATDEMLVGWWNDLGDEDPVQAYKAVWAMIATGDAATGYIQSHLPASQANDAFPMNIDQEKLWSPGSFKLVTADDRRKPRAIHVLEVIHSTDSMAMLKAMGYPGTPEGAPPDRWTEIVPAEVLKKAEVDLQDGNNDHAAAAVAAVRDLIVKQKSNAAIDFLIKHKLYDEALSACLTSMLIHADVPLWVSKCQRGRTVALMGMDKDEEALAAAKGYYNVALIPESDDAINLVAQCLAKVHPDGEFAARFKDQQAAWGDTNYTPPTTQPTNDSGLGEPILPTIKIDPKPYASALRSGNTASYQSCVALGNLLLLSDNATGARGAFEKSLALAKGPRVKAAVMNIARAIRAAKGCLGPARAYIDSNENNGDAPN